MIELDNVSKVYQPDSQSPVMAVRELSLDVQNGETLCLIGSSGCGKTTLMLGLMRLLPAGGRIVTGQVNFMGRDLMQLSEPEMNDKPKTLPIKTY